MLVSLTEIMHVGIALEADLACSLPALPYDPSVAAFKFYYY